MNAFSLVQITLVSCFDVAVVTAFVTVSSDSLFCHMHSMWNPCPCSHQPREQDATDRPASSGVHGWTPVELHYADLWTWVRLKDVEPWRHPCGVCLWQFPQKHANDQPQEVIFVGLWKCSSCFSWQKGADSDPVVGLKRVTVGEGNSNGASRDLPFMIIYTKVDEMGSQWFMLPNWTKLSSLKFNWLIVKLRRTSTPLMFLGCCIFPHF